MNPTTKSDDARGEDAEEELARQRASYDQARLAFEEVLRHLRERTDKIKGVVNGALNGAQQGSGSGMSAEHDDEPSRLVGFDDPQLLLL